MKMMKERYSELEEEFKRVRDLMHHYRGVIADLEAREIKDQGYSPSAGMHDAMERVIIAAGGPVHYKAIYDALVAMGVRVKGEDPIKNTGAHLSSDARFESRGEGMWGLTEWSSPFTTHAGPRLKAVGEPTVIVEGITEQTILNKGRRIIETTTLTEPNRT